SSTKPNVRNATSNGSPFSTSALIPPLSPQIIVSLFPVDRSNSGPTFSKTCLRATGLRTLTSAPLTTFVHASKQMLAASNDFMAYVLSDQFLNDGSVRL